MESELTTSERLMIAACQVRFSGFDLEPVSLEVGKGAIIACVSLSAFRRQFSDYERDPDGYTFRKRIGSVIFEAVDLEAYKRERHDQ